MVLGVYSSIKEMPIKVSKSFSAYVVKDAGIGSDMQSVDEHLGKTLQYLAHKRVEDATEEVKNMRYNIFVMLTGMDYRAMSMLCLVASVNGQPWVDHTDEGLARLLEMIEQYPVGTLEAALEEVKKNWIPNAEFISRSISPQI